MIYLYPQSTYFQKVFPLIINNLIVFSKTHFQFNNWGPGQPDGTIRADGFGNEACTALLLKNGNYKWYDEPCNTRRQLVCEDLPVPNINFVRNQNPGVNIP